jgi:hypothetical protein
MRQWCLCWRRIFVPSELVLVRTFIGANGLNQRDYANRSDPDQYIRGMLRIWIQQNNADPCGSE